MKKKGIFSIIRKTTEANENAGEWTRLLVVAGLVSAFGISLPVGYNMGVINTPAATIRSFCNESFVGRYNTTLTDSAMDILWSSIVSIFVVGGFMGSALGATVADSVGRKGTLHVINLLEVVGAALLYISRSANSVEMLIAGRWIHGFSGGLTVSVVPMYLIELAPLQKSGSVGVWCPMSITFGILMGQLMGLESILGGAKHWPLLLSVYGLVVIICTPIIFFLPESPKYLYVTKSKPDLATKELVRLRGVPESQLTEEIAQFRAELKPDNASRSYGMWRVARDKTLRLPLILVCAMQAGQQLSGINAVFYYSSSTFAAVGMNTSAASWATLGVGVTNCTASVVSLCLSARSRRSTILLSIFGVTISLIILGLSGSLTDLFGWMTYISLAATLLFVFSCGTGLGPIPYFIGSELFEVGPRPAAMSWGAISHWVGNFIIGISFPSIQALAGSYAFLAFAVITTALLIFVRKYLPETQGKTPSEAAALCRDGFNSKPLKSSTMKELYTTELDTYRF